MPTPNIQLKWDESGPIDVILDLRPKRPAGERSIVVYDGSTAVHARFGGERFYASRKGDVFQGWIPFSTLVKKVHGFQTDTKSHRMFAGLPGGKFEEFLGFGIFVPVNRKRKNIDEDLPIMLIHKEMGFVFVPVGSIAGVVTGKIKVESFPKRTVRIRYIPAPGQEIQEKEICARAHTKCQGGAVRRVLTGWEASLLSGAAVAFRWPEGFPPDIFPAFWRRLGLFPFPDGWAYRVAGGICRQKYLREELENVDRFQEMAPKNVFVMTPRVYLQESQRANGEMVYELIAISEDGKTCIEKTVDGGPAILAMQGDEETVEAFLEEAERELGVEASYQQREEEMAHGS